VSDADASRSGAPPGTVIVPAALAPAFEAAEAFVRRYFADRTEDPAHGTLAISGERYILVRAASMSVEFFDLVRKLYADRGDAEAERVAMHLLYDVAHAIGKADARAFHARLGVTDPVERLSTGPVHFAYAGWATVAIDPRSAPAPDDGYVLVYDHPWSFEADAWLRAGRHAEGPTCVMNAGYSSGWCSESFGFELVAAAVTCRARGDARCRFVMAPPARIEQRVAEVLAHEPEAVAPVRIPAFFARKDAEERLRRENEALEARVRERTDALQLAVAQLAAQVEARSASEAAIAERERRMEQALRSVKAATWHWDLATDTVDFSDALGPALGLRAPAKGAAVRSAILGRLHPDDRALVLREWGRLTSQPGEVQREVRVRWEPEAPGWRWVSLQARVEPGPGGRPVRALGVVVDITDQKAAAEERQALERSMAQAQKLESLGVLAGGIAHDFNNLLVGILGNAELALGELDEATEVGDIVRQIERAATRAADLTRQMLAYAGRARFVVEPLELNRVISDTSDLVSAAISKMATLQFDFAEGLPLVEADPTQVRQVLMNLLVNASDALGERPGTITVATRPVQADRALLRSFVLGADLPEGDYVRLVVSDTGSGMDAATMARVFEPFFSTKFTGRGLGLAAVLGIMRAHKGAIAVDSEPGAGTSFTLLLPASARPREDAVIAPRRTPPSAMAVGGGIVLVVDDDETVREVAHQILKRAGLKVLLAADGQAAAQIVRTEPRVDLVLLDATMPVMSGPETIGALREDGWVGPVIVMSGHAMEEAAAQFAAWGATGFVQKPFRRSDLVGTVLARLMAPGGLS
jgi:signal transduction histidine kinase/CheY-like chemotaxis protein